jgi:hypothetical protein
MLQSRSSAPNPNGHTTGTDAIMLFVNKIRFWFPCAA